MELSLIAQPRGVSPTAVSTMAPHCTAHLTNLKSAGNSRMNRNLARSWLFRVYTGFHHLRHDFMLRDRSAPTKAKRGAGVPT